MSVASAELLKKEFVPRYVASGEERFYRFLLFYATNKLRLAAQQKMPTTPEVEFLEFYSRFLVLYRREGEEAYLQIARIFRRAAHKMYRVLLKKQLTTYNAKFLNLV